MSRNHYIGIIVEGKLHAWRGRNPNKFPEDINKALGLAQLIRDTEEKTAYPVEITELKDGDIRLLGA